MGARIHLHTKNITPLIDIVGNIFRPVQQSRIPENPETILVVFLHGFGDAILCSGFFRELRNKYKNARIDVAADKRALVFLKRGKWFDHIREIGNPGHSIRKNGLMSGLVFVRDFKKLKNIKYQLGINLYGDFAGNLGLNLSGAGVRVGHTHNGGGFFLNVPVERDYSHIHQKDILQEVASAVGLSDKCRKPDFPFISESKQKNTSFIILAPGALHRSKRWPAERFRDLCEWLNIEYQMEIKLLGSIKEKPLCDTVKNNQPFIHNLAGQPCIEDLFRIIKEASLFVGNDSALAHAAAAFDIPLVQIFGPGRPERFGYRAAGKAVCQQVDCPHHPCSPYECRNKNGYCIDRVTLADVQRAVRGQMKKESREHL